MLCDVEEQATRMPMSPSCLKSRPHTIRFSSGVGRRTDEMRKIAQCEWAYNERFPSRVVRRAELKNESARFVSHCVSDIDWYQKPPGSCSSHLLNPARDRNMQIRRDPYSLESTRLDPRNRGFTRVARGEQPISERLRINKYGVKWKVIENVDLVEHPLENAFSYI